MVFCQISFVEPGKVGLGKNNGIVETLIGNAVIKFKRFAKVFSLQLLITQEHWFDIYSVFACFGYGFIQLILGNDSAFD